MLFETRRLFTAVTCARQLSLSWASLIHSTTPYPTSWRSFLISSYHLRLGLSSGILPTGFATKTLHTPVLSPIQATCLAHLTLLGFITRNILGEQYGSLSSSSSFPHSHYCSPLRLKYFEYPILKHPQPTFLPQCKRPSYTPIQNNRQNYSSVYLNL